MTQFDYGTIDPDTKNGSTLATDLNSHRDAVHSQHSGTSRPSYAAAGLRWLDTSVNPWVRNLYDGADDIIEGYTDTTTNRSTTYYKHASTGSVATTIEDSFDKIINVMHFGATGDGTTDDLTAIQAAINAAATLAGTGLTTSAGIGIYFPSGYIYYIASSITIPHSLDGAGLYSDPSKGAMIKSATNTTAVIVGDATLANATYNTVFSNLYFQAEDDESSDTIAIQFYRSPNTIIDNCQFNGYYISLDGVRLNQSYINKTIFYNTDRTTVAAKAAIRLQGGDITHPGGGLHITDCEFIGNAASEGMVESQMLVHAVDGLYLTQCHFAHQVEALTVEPLGTAANNIITDIYSEQCYFDNPHTTNSHNVHLKGTIDSGGLLGLGYYQNIKFNNCHFRGAGNVGSCIKVSIIDGGGFASAGRKVKNIHFHGGTIKQAQNTGLYIEGVSSARLEVHGLRADDVFFEGHNVSNTASITTGINAEVESLLVSSCVFEEDAYAGLYNITANLSNSPSGSPSVTIRGNNDFSNSNVTSINPVRWTNTGSAIVNVGGNTYPGKGQEFNQLVKGSTTNRAPLILWDYVIDSAGQVGAINTRTVGAETSATAGTEAAVVEHRAAFRRISGGTAALNGLTEVYSYETMTSQETPVVLNLLTGPSWAATTAYSAGALLTNAGNLYLVIVAGTTASTAPTHISGVTTDGTTSLGYVSATAANTLALIVSGAASTDVSWISDIKWLAVP